jgi:hypothetical protein
VRKLKIVGLKRRGVLLGAVLLLVSGCAGSLAAVPSRSTVPADSTFTVALRIEAGGDDINGVEATVSYDQSRLQFVSISADGTAFPIQLLQSGGNGEVHVVRGILGGTVTGDVLIATVTFKAIGVGNTTLAISGNATSAGDYTNPSGSSTEITVVE